MGSLYRSEQMRFCQMIVQKDAAFSCVAELGKHPYVQFKDLNADVSPFQRMYLRDIQRFEELERKLRFLDAQIRKDDIEVNDDVSNDGTYEILAPHELNQLEGTLIDLERDVIDMNENNILLKQSYLELKEWEAILEKTDHFLKNDVAMQEIEAVEDESAFILKREKEPIGFLAGVINRDRLNAFEKVLWRACHKTAFVRTSDIEEELEDPGSGKMCLKSVFLVFYKGDRLRIIIEKVCEGFKAKIYHKCPKNSKDRHVAARDVRARISDMHTVLGQTQEHRYKVLQAASNSVKQWQKEVRMQKSVYYTLNLFTFDAIGKFLLLNVGYHMLIWKMFKKSGSSVRPVLNLLETTEEPPTYNRVNKFTSVFQSIVDSYGTASYLEINPAPYTIITFPFLFSCMFGDLGHGILMLIAGLWMVLREKNLEARNIKDEIFTMFFGGRYIILLMGIFRNAEIESWDRQSILMHKEMLIDLPPSRSYMHDSGPYWFGVDPIWNMAKNRLNFSNSLKMKLSVVLGIAQMTFGILFMLCIFVYLCVQIIVKWSFFWVQQKYIFGLIYPGSNCAPSLLIGLISMFMFKNRPLGFIDTTRTVISNSSEIKLQEWPNCHLNQWYPRQSAVEAVLVIIAVICIPVMLFGKPIHFLLHRKKRNVVSDNTVIWKSQENEKAEITLNENGSGLNWEEATTSDNEHKEESFMDVMVHQAIHTIEYVLGCVSHTASYLRLWALSLAHAQLSEVLWEMLLARALAFPALPAISLLISYFWIRCFDLFSSCTNGRTFCFLTRTRLHWVEFQSKFYLGLGYPFVPFYFKDVLLKASAGDK
ncbi:hypothetical protein DINM_020665 [Dirofilaria immitis]|nr:hypothetical protein [Dirofilaria immitis]